MGHGYLPLVRNNGETNPGTYVVVVLLAAAGFYLYHVAPVYWDNMDAREAASEALSVYILKGEETARAGLMFRLNNNPNTNHFEVDDEGVESIKPGLGLKPEDVTIDVDEKTKKIVVRIQYDRIVEFSPLKKRKVFHLVAEKIGTIR